MAMVLSRIHSCLRRVRHFRNILFSGKHLLFTNVAISASLSGVGDMIEQNYMVRSGQQDKWNRVRTYNMSLSGIPVGIICHSWYELLDRRLPERTFKVVMKKVLYDQIIFSPINICVFFLTISLLEGKNFTEIAQETWNKGKLLYAAEWLIWPPAQIINFYFLPHKYRVLYDSIISLGFDVYMSHLNYDKVMI